MSFGDAASLRRSIQSSLRVVLKESPNLSVRLAEAALSKGNVSARVVLKETPNADKGAGDSVLSRDAQWISAYISSYANGCSDINQQLSAKKSEYQLCGTANDASLNHCHACIPRFGTSH